MSDSYPIFVLSIFAHVCFIINGMRLIASPGQLSKLKGFRSILAGKRPMIDKGVYSDAGRGFLDRGGISKVNRAGGGVENVIESKIPYRRGGVRKRNRI